MKSERLSAAWAVKKDCARRGRPQPPRRKDGRVTEAMTAELPAWVRERGGRMELAPERAALVRRIFRMAAGGYGCSAIVGKLTAEGVPAMGRTGHWSRSYVWSILSDRRAVGEHQPKRGDDPDGPPIPNYFPAAVTEAEWLAARAGAGERKISRGRGVGLGGVNIFAGLLRCARDGDSYHMTQRLSRPRGRPPRKYAVLINNRAVEGLGRAWSVPYDLFESAILSQLAEIDPHEILNGDLPPDETRTLSGELTGIQAELDDAAAFMEANGFSPTIGQRIAALEARKQDVAARLADARARAAHPVSESWGDCQSLIGVLTGAADPVEVRLRLRSALRRIVEDMRILVLPLRRDRLVAVQIWFAGGKRNRSYMIAYRPAGNRRPGGWRCWSFAEAGMPTDALDLRKKSHAARLEKASSSLDPADFLAGAE
jgi:hypothetical protein